MTNLTKNIVKFTTALGLIIALMLPSVLNLLHSFEHETHVIACDNVEQVHLHEIDFKCSFIQLYATPQFYSLSPSYNFSLVLHHYQKTTNKYAKAYFPKNLVNNKKKRGPPALNS